MKEPLTVGLFADQYAFNFGKATKFEIPAKDAYLTAEDLYKDEKAINNFSDKGFMRHFAQSLVDDLKWQKELEAEWAEEVTPATP